MKYLSIYIVLGFLLSSCQSKFDGSDDLPIARVYDKYLTTSRLLEIMPPGLSPVDSLTWVKDYVDKWIRKELIVHKAEQNLSDEEQNLGKQLEDYRTSLLIFKYEQNLIQQKLDTVISNSEIEEYYNANGSNFILNNDIVKTLYIKISKNTPDIWKVRRWYRSERDQDIKDLDAFCYQHAEEYNFFNEDWVQFDEIRQKMPRLYSNNANLLRNRKSIETSDSNYYYFVRLYDYKLAGDVSPLENIEGNIKNIILNKRKIKFTKRLESEIYNDALNRDNFNIY